ncbi:uncharacterized protein NECHADRAFT_75789 [Fusarium vanettenii 77-13-4]|uniref:Zn(2)-C6 fungal-type domain-containing protein n=1 Tax=Fusarium vanettenii (strain ATCC MYA-4622 / CBS 123669 / FGSC 9596 / NRRL 45880 / 77-13-4) TaxID=660122 RepID=C7YJT3_FUSV7|nr:uncharacterized protein NECHADRAFT_75789 [Fusarium vanettenii 77-13-4]EEU48329.1 hypothetical protein NECHADRAFT_75789 [Fusarium vanettenii 77-13-4]
MAPSTATPSNLHRAPLACLKCRTAKVRCLVSQSSDRCDRCTTNDTDCVFTQPKRAKARVHPYSRRPRRTPTQQEQAMEHVPALSTSPLTAQETTSVPQHPTPVSHELLRVGHSQQTLITPEIRARIVATLATLKGQRGAPFSFITSGDSPSVGEGSRTEESIHVASQQPLSFEQSQSQSSAPSLKLSWLLRPLRASDRSHAGEDIRQSTPWVKMPSYLASLTLGQIITDPIEGGILTRPASVALFQHFMLEMNAKWEYILDPYLDTHDDIRRRSRLLFVTVLFCSSKFANYINGNLISTPDPFLQSRLCSVARNLAIRVFAEGDRSIETMQAFYLLVCWKDADDDVSYCHSGYAFRILHDLDLDQSDGDGDRRQVARSRRTWLALFRQDKQQSLFFMRRATLSLDGEDPPFVGYLNTWLKMPYALPQDFIACCSADLRHIQSKLRTMVRKAPSIMLPCLLELMDSELNRWKSTWENHIEGGARLHPDDLSLDRRLLHPGKGHIKTLMGLWENSVQLNVASAILRQALVASVTSPLHANGQSPPSTFRVDLPGIPAIEEVLSPDIPGLISSVEGGFGTLRHLLAFPIEDLRRAPDSTLLLGPNTALFLCLLLCLPCNGVLGPAFQKTAIGLIQDIARHVGQAVQSPQDTLSLHSAYLDSLVNLLGPATPQWPPNSHERMRHLSTLDLSQSHMDANDLRFDETALEAAQVLAGGMGGLNCNVDDNNAMFSLTSEPEQMLYMQSLANLLDTSFFSATEPTSVDVNGNTKP